MAVGRRHQQRSVVTLTAEERDGLDRTISRGCADARKLVHARVLQVDVSEGEPGWLDAAVSETLRASVRAIKRVRQRLVENEVQATGRRQHGSRAHLVRNWVKGRHKVPAQHPQPDRAL